MNLLAHGMTTGGGMDFASAAVSVFVLLVMAAVGITAIVAIAMMLARMGGWK